MGGIFKRGRGNMCEFFNWDKFQEKGMFHVKEFYERYIKTVDSLECPSKKAVEMRNHYEKFLGYWDTSIEEEQKICLIRDMIAFYNGCISECNEFLDKCGDWDGEISMYIDFDEEVLRLLEEQIK
jgi:hypothetical protein